MRNTFLYIAGVLMFLIPSVAGAQALPFTVSDSDPVILAKGGAGLTETGSVSHAAFTNAAVVPFSDKSLDVSVGYMAWQQTSAKNNVLNLGAAYNFDGKLGIAAALYYGKNPKYEVLGTGDTFSPTDIHASLGVSYRFLDFMSAGVNIGYAGSKLAKDQNYATVACDAFVMAKFDAWKVTAGVSNLFGSIQSAGGTKFSIPGSVALGAGYDFDFGEGHVLDANLDVDYFFSGSLAASVGASYTYNDIFSIRGGYHYGGKSPIPSYASIGHGVKFYGVNIDFAYILTGSDSPMKDTIALCLGYSF